MGRCNNKKCDHFNDSFCPPHNNCELFYDATECEHYVDCDWRMPIHSACGLPVELCQCKDAQVVFIDGKFIDTKTCPACGSQLNKDSDDDTYMCSFGNCSFSNRWFKFDEIFGGANV